MISTLKNQNKSFCIHHQDIKRLLNEIYKDLHDITGKNLKELFAKRESIIILRSKSELVIPLVNSILKGKSSLKCFDPVIWNSLLIEIRVDHSISSFVTKIKQWKSTSCPLDSPFDDCFMTFVMYILDVFIARMGLGVNRSTETLKYS